jgi:hypothetical protein
MFFAIPALFSIGQSIYKGSEIWKEQVCEEKMNITQWTGPLTIFLNFSVRKSRITPRDPPTETRQSTLR